MTQGHAPSQPHASPRVSISHCSAISFLTMLWFGTYGEGLDRFDRTMGRRECYFQPETRSRCRLTSTSFCFWLGSPGSPPFSFEKGKVAPGRSKSKPAGAYCWKASASHLYGKADSGDTSPVGSSFPPWCS